MDFYRETKETALQNLQTGENGLTDAEAKKRLLENGRNELAKAKKKSLLRRFAEQLINPMVLVLIAAAAVSLVIAITEGGNPNEYAEAGIILAVVVLNSVLGVFQESKAEKAIEALQEMSASTAKVRRGGVVAQLPAGELVVGDVVLMEAGDAVPADMRLIQAASLKIEEAALTGESVPSDKQTGALEGGGTVALGDRTNMAYMGSGVAYGRGEGVVTATGMGTEMGKIAGIIQSTEQGETPLQKSLSRLSKILSFLVLGICAVIFAVRLVSTGNFNTEGVLDSFMLAVSLAVAAIPEGLAAVVTIVLSIGVTNMARRRAIIRRLTAVETLGCAQIICSDKTGTLTQNKMTVVESFGETKPLAAAMALCCDSQLSPDGKIVGDPTENALVAFALQEGLDKNKLMAEFPRVGEAPFDSVRKMMTTVHKTGGGAVQYTKGAPDEILRACTHILADGNVTPLTPEALKTVTDKNKEYADRALRVLACAFREWDGVPADCSPGAIENGLTLIGLEAMIDPIRPEVKAAADECRSAGIKVVMITGDHKETAAAIAKELGIIESSEQAMTGRELDELTDEEFERRIENTFVYARVQPENKVRIVNMWKKKGYVTAMTGDGVNDAPAIKSGDIGVGMGITGTDVTKNVADMVLADDNFATIVAAVEEGRRIYDNIRKTIQFLLSSNLSEVLSIFLATVLGFVLFKPVHLLFINLITDSLPAVALGMEHAQPGIMQRPPRKVSASVFSGGLGFGVIYQGIFVALLTVASYKIVDQWHNHDYAMTAAFLTMSMCEIFHSYNMRSQTQSVFTLKKANKMLLGAMLLSLVLTLTVIYVPFLAGIFSLQPLSVRELAVALGLSVSIIPLVEAVKAAQRARESRRINRKGEQT
ncbi:MAG: cation-translocating P-type ATPase [Oscillospiraceae bacterium]|nr:cation-translocating P-type ATPase [Oscillospiraceae bacterium]